MKKNNRKDKIGYKNKIRKKQLDSQRENEKLSNESKERMKQRLTKITGMDHDIIRNDSLKKMSEALLKYAEPLLDAVDINSKEAFDKAIMISIIYWNCAILQDEPGREKEIKKMLKSITSGPDGKSVTKYMLNRKRAMYPNNKKIIVDYDITEMGDKYNLKVASISDV